MPRFPRREQEQKEMFQIIHHADNISDSYAKIIIFVLFNLSAITFSPFYERIKKIKFLSLHFKKVSV
ncbi:hypothetical protein BARVI_01265 [Barnesiella viscericola DSM 18177]|uniref:Uncharacterized protein n=1 Tax=Barnesiella viscericola DSM 18177 TaxID=880074 RepID=W0EWV8_9BACT|nr:hypothetical protein BARVI_01265 [Barnesiella viscericola DSM 18177]